MGVMGMRKGLSRVLVEALETVSGAAGLRAQLGTVIDQRDMISRERDELKVHCQRLEAQLAEQFGHLGLILKEREELKAHCKRLANDVGVSHARQEQAERERDELLRARDALQRERDDLLCHCRRLSLTAEGLERKVEPIQSIPDVLQGMRNDWDRRARENALFYTNSAQSVWDEADYFSTGEANVREQILNDMENICQGSPPKQMRVVEIGCGAGRMTRPLAEIFGEVYAIDISAEMLSIARTKLRDVANVRLYHGSGVDLREIPDGSIDFAFSYIVFQHIPSRAIIEGYIREVSRVLKRGRLFKFQLQGASIAERAGVDTWLGVGFSLEDMYSVANRAGFELRHFRNPNRQDFWVWFFRT